MNAIVGSHDLLWLVFDTLRFDVAQEAWAAGETPFLASLLGPEGWEARQTPGNFTYAAHQAFFAGFLPTPPGPGPHPRLFAARFAGSTSTGAGTCVLDAPDLPRGLAERGYRTICIGGVGFFNLETPLGKALPGLFQEAHWSPALGVTDPDSTRHQVELACRLLGESPPQERVFLFINLSALHQPNCHYLPGAEADSRESHAAALAYVDSQLEPLVAAFRKRGESFALLCADHGTCYGEEGLWGHRVNHPAVLTVPYAEVLL